VRRFISVYLFVFVCIATTEGAVQRRRHSVWCCQLSVFISLQLRESTAGWDDATERLRVPQARRILRRNNTEFLWTDVSGLSSPVLWIRDVDVINWSVWVQNGNDGSSACLGICVV